MRTGFHTRGFPHPGRHDPGRLRLAALSSFVLAAACGNGDAEDLFDAGQVEGASAATRILELGVPIRLAAPDHDMIGALSHVTAWDSDLVVVDHVAVNVKVFDRHGQFRFSIGRAGDGPGEFSVPASATVNGEGRLLVRDSHRITTFDRTGEPVEFFTFPGYGGHGIATVAEDGDVLLATQLATGDGVTFGPLVHVFDGDGQVVRSLGTAPELHDPLEDLFLVAMASVSLDGTVAWVVQSRPVMELSVDWGRTIDTVRIEGIPPPDWEEIGNLASRDAGGDPDAWMSDYVSRFPLLNGIGFVRKQPVLKFFRDADGPKRYVYVTIDRSSGRQTGTEATRHNVYWDRDESGHGWSAWMDEGGTAYAQRVFLDDGRGPASRQ